MNSCHGQPELGSSCPKLAWGGQHFWHQESEEIGDLAPLRTEVDFPNRQPQNEIQERGSRVWRGPIMTRWRTADWRAVTISSSWSWSCGALAAAASACTGGSSSDYPELEDELSEAVFALCLEISASRSGSKDPLRASEISGERVRSTSRTWASITLLFWPRSE